MESGWGSLRREIRWRQLDVQRCELMLRGGRVRSSCGVGGRRRESRSRRNGCGFSGRRCSVSARSFARRSALHWIVQVQRRFGGKGMAIFEFASLFPASTPHSRVSFAARTTGAPRRLHRLVRMISAEQYNFPSNLRVFPSESRSGSNSDYAALQDVDTFGIAGRSV